MRNRRSIYGMFVYKNTEIEFFRWTVRVNIAFYEYKYKVLRSTTINNENYTYMRETHFYFTPILILRTALLHGEKTNFSIRK